MLKAMDPLTNRTRCLDLSRLVSRVGRGPWTGVDRVEAAYLRQLLEQPSDLFGLVRTSLGYVLLDRQGVQSLSDRFHGSVPWGTPDLLSRIFLKPSSKRRAAESDLRRFCIARSGRSGLQRMLARHLPAGCSYLNVGHSNLRPHLFDAMRHVDQVQISVLVHDMIPLDLPTLQREGAVERFTTKMRAVSRHSDLVICNSEVTRKDTEHHFDAFGRVPEMMVAHLGIDLPQCSNMVPSPYIPLRPYFVVVGTIEPRKNHALLLDVWERLSSRLDAESMPELLIIGSRGWKNEEVFTRLEAKPRFVTELNGLSDDEVASLVDGARALLMPSLAEGFGLPVVEAIALGTPAIVNDLPVYREILGNSPIYANVTDVYSWENEIVGLTAQARPEVAGAQADLPNWVDHFNQVLMKA